MNEYQKLKDKHSKEFSSFPVFFAFSVKQFNEGMEKLGLEKSDRNKVCSIRGGGYLLKTNVNKLKDMFASHSKELDDAIKADTKGDKFIYDMFNYELANHEYGYTGELEDTLEALGLSLEDIAKSEALINGLKLNGAII